MIIQDGARGEYFLIGKYIAMKASDGGPWRVSKVEHNPRNSKIATLTLVGEWWTEEDARAGIARSAAHDMESVHTVHPPTWPNYIDNPPPVREEYPHGWDLA